MFASDMPLSQFENKYWKTFFSHLRPTWNPPSVYKLGTPLLNDEFKRVEETVSSAIEGAKVVAIECDGWSNKR